MKAIIGLALALIAGTLCAQDVVYYTGTSTPQPAPGYQSIIIDQPPFNVSVDPPPIEVQIPCPQITVSYPQSNPCVPCVPCQQPQQVVVPTATSTCQPCVQYGANTVVMQSCPPQTTCAQNVATQYPTTQSYCPNGQCYPASYQSVQSVPSNYVADSDRGTNFRYEPAILRTEDGYERVMKTPIRAALTVLRVNRDSSFDRDPPSLPIGPSFP